jgi:hypothetical protein
MYELAASLWLVAIAAGKADYAVTPLGVKLGRL